MTSAATLVGVLAIFNGGGRIFWAAVSDKIGRMHTFAAILVLQGVCLLLLPHASNAMFFAILAAIVYLCYGGTFGTMPATAGDFFGVRHAGAIYGLMLIGWSLGGIIGPLHRLRADRRGQGLHGGLHDDRHHRARVGGAHLHHQGA